MLNKRPKIKMRGAKKGRISIIGHNKVCDGKRQILNEFAIKMSVGLSPKVPSSKAKA